MLDSRDALYWPIVINFPFSLARKRSELAEIALFGSSREPAFASHAQTLVQLAQLVEMGPAAAAAGRQVDRLEKISPLSGAPSARCEARNFTRQTIHAQLCTSLMTRNKWTLLGQTMLLASFQDNINANTARSAVQLAGGGVISISIAGS